MVCSWGTKVRNKIINLKNWKRCQRYKKKRSCVFFYIKKYKWLINTWKSRKKTLRVAF